MSDISILKFEKIRGSCGKCLHMILAHRRLDSLSRLNYFSLSKLVSLLFIVILAVTSAKAFEIELCNKDLSRLEDTNGDFSSDLNTKGSSRERSSESPLQDHNFCHQNHICQLIIYDRNNFILPFNVKNSREACLFPPEDLFLEGPFKPPKF